MSKKAKKQAKQQNNVNKTNRCKNNSTETEE